MVYVVRSPPPTFDSIVPLPPTRSPFNPRWSHDGRHDKFSTHFIKEYTRVPETHSFITILMRVVVGILHEDSSGLPMYRLYDLNHDCIFTCHSQNCQ